MVKSFGRSLLSCCLCFFVFLLCFFFAEYAVVDTLRSLLWAASFEEASFAARFVLSGSLWVSFLNIYLL